MIHALRYYYLLCGLALLGGSLLHAQVIKPPVAEPDYAETFMTNPVSVNVLANDHAYEGDTLVILAITEVVNGQAWFQDSLVHFTPLQNGATAQHGKVYYMIKDLTTGLWSEEAMVTIYLTRVRHRIFNPNGLRVRINAVGNQFMALDTFQFEAPNHFFEAPAYSGKNTIYNSSLWIAGRDVDGHIHSACERMRKGKLPFASQVAWDFWTGPVMNHEEYTPQYLVDHNRLWYITREDILYHIQHSQDPGYYPGARIRNWPANGYPALGSASVLAPFHDVNQNNAYDPVNGDFPAIKGDEAVYFIFNDEYGEHKESRGRKLGIEVQGMAYGFSCEDDSAFHNTLFVRYNVINRSDTIYHSVYIGNYTHFAIGTPDDYLACDTLLNAFYAYNQDGYDDSTSLFYPSYGEHPPAQAVVLLNRPMDHFMYFHYAYPFVDTLFNWAPWMPEHYYNYMQSVWQDDTHLTYGGDGHLGPVQVDHALTGDPVAGSGWLEPGTGLEEVLYGIASSGPFNFFPGDTVTLELAYVFARDYEGNQLSSVALLKDRIERIRWFYENDSTPCGTPWTSTTEYARPIQNFNVSPNPAKRSIRMSESRPGGAYDYQVYNISGVPLLEGRINSGQKIDISVLSPGYYIIRLYNLEDAFAAKFIKIN